MPALAPHSMLMLQMVIRPSMLRPRTVDPRYSTRWPCPNEIPVRPITPRTTSFAVTPSGRSPSTVTARSPAPDLMQRDAFPAAVLSQDVHLLARKVVRRARATAGGDVVVHGGERQVGPADLSS